MKKRERIQGESENNWNIDGPGVHATLDKPSTTVFVRSFVRPCGQFRRIEKENINCRPSTSQPDAKLSTRCRNLAYGEPAAGRAFYFFCLFSILVSCLHLSGWSLRSITQDSSHECRCNLKIPEFSEKKYKKWAEKNRKEKKHGGGLKKICNWLEVVNTTM